jgi:alanine racemase
MDGNPVWAEIDLAAIAHNVREVRRVTGPETRVMAVVKANGYGHGAPEVARTALANGADYLGVARAQEGIELREAGIDEPILIFGYTAPDHTGQLITYRLTQTVYCLELARSFADAARAEGKTLKVHLKIDTGMGRLGLPLISSTFNTGQPAGILDGETLKQAITIAGLKGLDLEGIYTHFASADHADKKSARQQIAMFRDFLEMLRKNGVEVPIRHAANSAAIIDMEETHLDLVRPGIMLYGLYPSVEVNKSRVTLKPAMQVKARVAQVKDVPRGFRVSYGSTYETRQPTRIATVSAGYADGYCRLLSSCGYMLVHGYHAPVVGRVTMDQTMLDIGHIGHVSPGDVVVLFGTQGESTIHVDEIASRTGTINYEVVATIMARVPRVYSG